QHEESEEDDLEDQEDDDEEEDETPSVRSLLPLRLSLTLSRRRRASASRGSGEAPEEEQQQEQELELDDGEFDAQDAELWSSRAEKQAWIQRFERSNADFIEKYGCRIDSAAHPDAAQRLRRERRREGPYSLVLLALVLVYGIHLAVFPFEVPQQWQPMQSVTPSISQSVSLWSRWTSWPVNALHWASRQPWPSFSDWSQMATSLKKPQVQEEQGGVAQDEAKDVTISTPQHKRTADAQPEDDESSNRHVDTTEAEVPNPNGDRDDQYHNRGAAGNDTLMRRALYLSSPNR
ncbi:hypothetical protein PINS_up020918, partial [Pythium insidiosum]